MTEMQKDFLAIAASFLICTLSVGLIDGYLGAIPCFVVAGIWLLITRKEGGWMNYVPAALFTILGLVKLGWPG